ncbi:nitric oxide reductase activation protein [Paenibacillus phyllosphaerae]|uniref:Nitric oxide reductase activation protein n=1 Tax=Paenibacillus phyllosphaerae TaxID=274593 RepID=A0A7W5B4Y6_9BACL|nr:nitric oxide reductase activation protein NorD [Paenibacillus phyllosphaerae]MBB3114487.1 nitric oxide reductase activation protein [Paenibacillus phyllosphaerae]
MSYAIAVEPPEQDEEQKQLEKAFRKKLNQEARAIVSDSMHKSVKLIVHRPEYTREDREAYARTVKDLLPVVQEIARRAMPILTHDISVDYAGRHYYGSRFRADRLAYVDFRHFAKKRPPTEAPSLVVGLRIDESKSMNAAGRLEAARLAAIAIYEFCLLCDIPVLIAGDTADVSRLEQMSIYSYADYAKPDPNDRYRLLSIRARGNNRDGMALRIMADKLAEAPGQSKLLISISDGQPKAMEAYTGEAALQDIQQTISEYERRGVRFLAAAIGDDKDVINRIYGDGRYLDMSDLSRFPAEMVRCIARYL